MKLAIVFEVPDGQDDAYADIAARLIEHHAFAVQEKIEHWSFHQEMRPTAAVLIEPDMSQAFIEARHEIDQEHPWIPGAVFQIAPHLKDVLLAILTALI